MSPLVYQKKKFSLPSDFVSHKSPTHFIIIEPCYCSFNSIHSHIRCYCSHLIALITEAFRLHNFIQLYFIFILSHPTHLLLKKGLPASHYFSIIVGFSPAIAHHRIARSGGLWIPHRHHSQQLVSKSQMGQGLTGDVQ